MVIHNSCQGCEVAFDYMKLTMFNILEEIDKVAASLLGHNVYLLCTVGIMSKLSIDTSY